MDLQAQPTPVSPLFLPGLAHKETTTPVIVSTRNRLLISLFATSTYRVHHRHRHAQPRKPRHSPLETALISRHDGALDGRGEVQHHHVQGRPRQEQSGHRHCMVRVRACMENVNTIKPEQARRGSSRVPKISQAPSYRAWHILLYTSATLALGGRKFVGGEWGVGIHQGVMQIHARKDRARGNSRASV